MNEHFANRAAREESTNLELLIASVDQASRHGGAGVMLVILAVIALGAGVFGVVRSRNRSERSERDRGRGT